MVRRERQLGLDLRSSKRGGRRSGAGRKPALVNPAMPHRKRTHDGRSPVHVTMRVVDGVGSLRQRDYFLALRAATKVAGRRADFRIVHMSIQRTHVHMIVEADSQRSLSTGLQAFTISTARRINQAWSAQHGPRRRGQVLQDRYHARPLASPRDVRNTIRYCLNNWLHHSEDRNTTWPVDLYSSAPTYTDWRDPLSLALPASYHPLVVRSPRTWLLRCWRKYHPPLSFTDVPGHRARPPG